MTCAREILSQTDTVTRPHHASGGHVLDPYDVTLPFKVATLFCWPED